MTTDLTPNQQAALDHLQEECAEVIQMIAKVRRFGLANQKTPKHATNVIRLCKELIEVAVLTDHIINTLNIGVDNSPMEDDSLDAHAREKSAKYKELYPPD